MYKALLLIFTLFTNHAQAFEFPEFMIGKTVALHLEGEAIYDRAKPNCRWENNEFYRQSWANVTYLSEGKIRIRTEFLDYFESLEGVDIPVTNSGKARFFKTRESSDGSLSTYSFEVQFDDRYRPKTSLYYSKKEASNQCRGYKYGSRFSMSVLNTAN